MRLSPSQIKTWRDCRRKWGLIKLDGLEEPSSPAARDGSEIHQRLEKHIRDGYELDPSDRYDAAALRGIHNLGPVLADGSRNVVERSFAFPVFPGVIIRGVIDVLTVTADGDVVITDHKTSSDPARYGIRRPRDLESDPQAIIYAEALRREGIEPLVRFAYYPRRKGKKAHAVECRPGGIETLHDDIIAIANSYRRRDAAKDLPCNTASCTKYGGCYFLGNGCDAERTAEATFANAQFITTGQRKRRDGMTIDIDKLLAGIGESGETDETDETEETEVNPPEEDEDAPRDVGDILGGLLGDANDNDEEEEEDEEPLPKKKKKKKKTGPLARKRERAAAKKGYVLYEDAIPLAGHCLDAGKIVGAAHESVRETQSVDHYKCCEYGTGPGHLNAALVEILRGIDAKAIVALTGDPAVRDCIETLRAHAESVVKGVR